MALKGLMGYNFGTYPIFRKNRKILEKGSSEKSFNVIGSVILFFYKRKALRKVSYLIIVVYLVFFDLPIVDTFSGTSCTGRNTIACLD